MGAAGEADGGAGWWREAGARPSTFFFLATLPEGRRPVRGVREVDVLQHRGPGGGGEDEGRRRAGRATETQCVDSHGWERRSFGLTSLEVGGWRCPMGRRWRLASGRQKVVKWGRCRLASRGACGAGGAPAPGSGATTPLPGAGGQKAPSTRRCIKTINKQCDVTMPNSQKAPSTTRCIKTINKQCDVTMPNSQKAPSTTRCIKTFSEAMATSPYLESESTQHHKVH